MNSKTRYLTTGDDLKKILLSCKKCTLATGNGENIISHRELIHLKIAKIKKHKNIFICNTADDTVTIGHWFTIIVNVNNKTMYICDGLDYAITQKHVLKNIRQFCRINKLNLVNLQSKCQQKKSNVCGYISIFWVAKYTHLTKRNFMQLSNILKRQSIKSNESFILKFVQIHFKFTL